MKSVLVTGASTGLGKAIVRHFIHQEWKVIAHYFQQDDEFESLLAQYEPNQLLSIYADFLDQESFSTFLTQMSQYDIHALVNNAGIHDTSFDKTDRHRAACDVFTVNTICPARITECVMENMTKNKFGRIVNVSSIGAKYGSDPKNCFYGASKSALETITKSHARVGAEHNVLVNAIRPGVINTDFLHSLNKDLASRMKTIPLQRFAEVEEVANLIYFLCDNNSYITNDVVTISGGD